MKVDRHLPRNDVGRQGLLNLGHHLLHLLDDVHGVGSGLLLDDYLRSLHSVGVGFLRTFLKTVIHHSHVLEVNCLACGIAHDHIQHF